VLEHVNKIKLV